MGRQPWHRYCPSCRYESADLAPLINEAYAHSQVNESERETALKSVRTENFKIIVERLARIAPPTAKRLLDVGSAHGWFLDEAAKRFSVVGVEPDVVVAQGALARGLPVRVGYFPHVLEDGECFDVIVFNDVIEHIPDIHSALEACRAHLDADGLLVLNVPRSTGFFYRLSKLLARLKWRGPFDRMWQKGLPSPHVHYFNERNLDRLVARHGLRPVQAFHLRALSADGLLERIRFAGQLHPVALYAQYAFLLCALPLVRLLPSDIIVCIYSKNG
ncbi:class I SAM-dependent methyltransferase [Massilia soli]|uniref:class I SAM-dependent methyltransferase n=1 Tax=Massilia soli TaxID=2792854 RepID=UPI001CBDEAAE